MHHITAMDLLSSRSLRRSQARWLQARWSQAFGAHNLWRRSCEVLRHSAVFHARVVLESDAFRPGVLGEVDDALGVFGVDRVVPNVVRVLVSW